MASNSLAQMGYVGSVQLQPDGTGTPIVVRVTSSDIRTSQEITYPEVVDGRIDTTLYQLGPKITGGNLAFPLVHEGSALGAADTCSPSGNGTLSATLWAYAAQRDGVGRMYNKLAAHIRYADNTAFTYPGCYINTMTWNVVQSESVNVTAELFGGADSSSVSDTNRISYQGQSNPQFLAPARVVTWNDALIEIYNDSGVEILAGMGLREFSVTINNGLERVYTMNGKLAVQDIVPKKREISGTIKVLGRCSAIADDLAYKNEQNFTSRSAIAFGYRLGAQSAQAYWATAFYSVLFQIEEMAVTTGVFETTHNWRALGDCTRGYLATQMGDAVTINQGATPGGGLPYPNTYAAGGSNQYGANTGTAGGHTFPDF